MNIKNDMLYERLGVYATPLIYIKPNFIFILLERHKLFNESINQTIQFDL